MRKGCRFNIILNIIPYLNFWYVMMRVDEVQGVEFVKLMFVFYSVLYDDLCVVW